MSFIADALSKLKGASLKGAQAAAGEGEGEGEAEAEAER